MNISFLEATEKYGQGYEIKFNHDKTEFMITNRNKAHEKRKVNNHIKFQTNKSKCLMK
jgi:hypothetical protein